MVTINVLNPKKMSNSKFNIKAKLQLVFKLLLMLLLLQSCKSYKNSTMTAEAANNNPKETIKVIMQNGDKYLYERIESVDDQFYGVVLENDEEVKTLLKQEEIKSVQVYSKKSSLFTKFLGVTIVVGAIVLGVTML